jgi:hypothetical protein
MEGALSTRVVQDVVGALREVAAPPGAAVDQVQALCSKFEQVRLCARDDACAACR